MKALLHRLFGVLLLMSFTRLAGAGTPVSYHTARVDDLGIFYREAGPPGAPVVLLLHGLPSSSRMYQPLLDSCLAVDFRLIAPDYPGFGYSSWPNHRAFSYTFDHLAAVMEKFTEQLH